MGYKEYITEVGIEQLEAEKFVKRFLNAELPEKKYFIGKGTKTFYWNHEYEGSDIWYGRPNSEFAEDPTGNLVAETVWVGKKVSIFDKAKINDPMFKLIIAELKEQTSKGKFKVVYNKFLRM